MKCVETSIWIQLRSKGRRSGAHTVRTTARSFEIYILLQGPSQRLTTSRKKRARDGTCFSNYVPDWKITRERRRGWTKNVSIDAASRIFPRLSALQRTAAGLPSWKKARSSTWGMMIEHHFDSDEDVGGGWLLLSDAPSSYSASHWHFSLGNSYKDEGLGRAILISIFFSGRYYTPDQWISPTKGCPAYPRGKMNNRMIIYSLYIDLVLR